MLHGPATSTGGAALMVIVNGPIRERFGLNAKANLFGPGYRANATIGRTLRLVLLNCLDCLPGVLDKSTQGWPGKYSLCFAEDEASSPWEPLDVSRGFAAAQPEEAMALQNLLEECTLGGGHRPTLLRDSSEGTQSQ